MSLIFLAMANAIVLGSWYWLSTLSNRGTGGLGDAILPVLLTIVVGLVDIGFIIYHIYKYYKG